MRGRQSPKKYSKIRSEAIAEHPLTLAVTLDWELIPRAL